MKELTVSPEEFVSELKSGAYEGKQVVVDFWAAWCGPCRAVAPILDKLEKDNSNIALVKVNVDENPSLATVLGIQSIPTLMFFKDGEMNRRPIIGVAPQQRIEEHIA